MMSADESSREIGRLFVSVFGEADSRLARSANTELVRLLEEAHRARTEEERFATMLALCEKAGVSTPDVLVTSEMGLPRPRFVPGKTTVFLEILRTLKNGR